MDKKRIALIVIFLVVSILIGYLLYRVFFAAKKAPTTTTTGQPAGQVGTLPLAGTGTTKPVTGTQTGTLPTAQTGVQAGTTQIKKPIVKQVLTNSIKNPTINQSGQINFYSQKDGKYYRLQKDGSLQTLSDKVFYQVDNTTWSPKSDEAILEYPDGSNIYYNFTTKEQVSLPKHWEYFSFSSLGDKIAAKSIALNQENRWLISANADGSEISLLEPMGNNADKVIVDWSPNQQVVAFSRTGDPKGADEQEILLLGLNGENFKSITVEGRGFASQWSPTGKKLLYNVYNARNNYKPELWITNSSGDDIDTGRKLLQVSTWSDKCAFADERFVYCAVPNTLPVGAGFAPELANNIPDVLYRINVETGLRTPITTDGSHTIQQIMVSEDGNSLYFTDKQQAGLFEVKL